MPVYCIEGTISVAMKVEMWGYGIHGHDVRVEACIESRDRTDLEELRRLLGKVLARYDHRPLWETTGGSLIEDLLLRVCNDLRALLPGGAQLRTVEGRIPSGRIIMECHRDTGRAI